MLLTRKDLQKNEESTLASYAFKSSESKGRKFDEKIEDERLCFQRDKDRIIHCRAFRRLDEKTQVFIAGSGDHFRTRLTHTLEVAQIARDVARSMGLNEDLCEAIALAHDLGHPPFGHGGEVVLDELMQEYGIGFEHNQQSRRIVETLEKVYPDFDGLNLSYEVLDGLMKHQTSWDQAGREFEGAALLEAQVVNIADEIAYTNHDIDDGLRGGLISLEGLDKFELWQNAKEEVSLKYGAELENRIFISRMVSAVISLMIKDLCNQIDKTGLAQFSPEMADKLKDLRGFLYDNFYMSTKITNFINKGKEMISRLFNFYLKNPEKFPKRVEGGKKEFAIAIKDYIAGMTDGYAKKECTKFKL